MSIFFRRRKGPPIGPLILKGFIVTIFLSILGAASWSAWFWFSTDATALMPPLGSASASDGEGSALISPDVVTAGGEIDKYTITFQAGPEGIETGGAIYLVYPSDIVGYGNEFHVFIPFLATDSLKQFMESAVVARAEGGAILRVQSPSWTRKLRLVIGYYKSLWGSGAPAYSLRELARELVKHVIIVEEGKIGPSEDITITISRPEGLRAPRFANWTSVSVYVDGDGDGVASPLLASPRIITTGRKAAAFRVVATSSPKTWEKIKVVVAAIDNDGQLDPNYTGTVYLDAPNVALPSKTEFYPSDLGRKVFITRTPREGIYFIVARDYYGRFGRSNPMVVEERGLYLYWGDLHIHSILDYGGNVPEWALRTARDDMALDFASLTLSDHWVPFDSHLKFPGIKQTSFAWGHVGRITKNFNRQGVFSVINGFEWGDNRLGQRNIYYSPEDPDIILIGHAANEADTVEKLFHRLKGHRVIAAPHNTAWRGGRFMGKKYDWGARKDFVQRLVEVYSSHGASEFYDNPYPIHGRNEIENFMESGDQAGRWSGAFVRDGLAMGHKLGMIAGGDSRFPLDHPDSYPGGLTAVWAKKLTATNIWNSLYSRRCYGTTGARIFLRWTIGGSGPGNELSVDVPVEFRLFIVGTAPIKEAQIIKYDDKYEVAKRFSSKTEIIKTAWKEFNPPSRGFYYLRVTQEDGQMAWAGPIWVYRR